MSFGACQGPPAPIISPWFCTNSASNAAKYGVLSRDGRSVAVSWLEADNVRIVWTKRGVSSVELPRSTGLRTKLVESTIQRIGKIEYDWRPDGSCVRISISSNALRS
jgi:two-component sensor histidine kinase